jgi:hypothetical protein
MTAALPKGVGTVNQMKGMLLEDIKVVCEYPDVRIYQECHLTVKSSLVLIFYLALHLYLKDLIEWMLRISVN